MPRKRKSRPITVFLLKDADVDPSSILKGYTDLKQFDVRIGERDFGRLYLQTSEQSSPSWLSLFQDSVHFDLSENLQCKHSRSVACKSAREIIRARFRVRKKSP